MADDVKEPGSTDKKLPEGEAPPPAALTGPPAGGIAPQPSPDAPRSAQESEVRQLLRKLMGGAYTDQVAAMGEKVWAGVKGHIEARSAAEAQTSLQTHERQLALDRQNHERQMALDAQNHERQKALDQLGHEITNKREHRFMWLAGSLVLLIVGSGSWLIYAIEKKLMEPETVARIAVLVGVAGAAFGVAKRVKAGGEESPKKP